MFPWQVFGLTGSTLLTRLPEQLAQCHRWLSYLLTAAGQFRILTGFPFHSRTREHQRTVTLYLELEKISSPIYCVWLVDDECPLIRFPVTIRLEDSDDLHGGAARR